MFPLRDDNPHFLQPWVTWAIVSINAAAWIFVQGLGTAPSLATSICSLGLIPGDFLGILPTGGSTPIAPGIACVIEGSVPWYTPVTSMFLHGGWMHLLGNMWFLWIFGNNVEDSMGHVRFAVFYLVCGLSAAAIQVSSAPESPVPMVGASGAIGGVMGAYVMLYPRVHVHMLIFLGFFITTIAVPAIFMLGYWFLIQLIGGFSSLGSTGGGVAFWAHIGGFGAGALLINLFKDPVLLRRHPYYGWKKRSGPTKSWRRVR